MMKKAALGVAVLATKKGQKAAKKMLKGKTQMSPALNYLDRNLMVILIILIMTFYTLTVVFPELFFIST